MAHDVFISHSIDDADVADAVRAALEARGFSCWIDTAADKAIPASRVVILILSSRSAGSPQIVREAERAQNVPVVVFRIDEVEPSAALGRATEGAEVFDALTPPVGPHLDYLGDRVALVLGGSGRQLTEPPRPFVPSARRSRNWLPIAAAGLAGLAAIAVAAMVSGQ
jgi:hypothetical protein